MLAQSILNVLEKSKEYFSLKIDLEKAQAEVEKNKEEKLKIEEKIGELKKNKSL